MTSTRHALRHRRRVARFATIPVLVCAAIVAAACGSDGGRAVTLGDGEEAAAGLGGAGSELDGGQAVRGPDGELLPRAEVEIPDSWPSDIDELYGRYWLYWEAFAAAHGPPFADPEHETLRELSSPTNWSSLQTQLQGFQDDGLLLVLPEDSQSDHLLRFAGTTAVDKTEGNEVLLQDCWIDDFVQQAIDGDVLSAAAEAKLMNVTMKVVDGEWTVHGVTRGTPDSDWYEECASQQPKP